MARGQGQSPVPRGRAPVGRVIVQLMMVPVEVVRRVGVGTLVATVRRRALVQVAWRRVARRVAQEIRVAVLAARAEEAGYAARTVAEDRVAARRGLGAQTRRCRWLRLRALPVRRHIFSRDIAGTL